MKERRGCIRLDEEKLFWQNVDVLLVDTINYLKKLISFKSYSEEEKDIVDYIEKTVWTLISLYGNDTVKTERIGNSYLVEFNFNKEETLMLVGHVDIVHENSKKKWSSDPFELNIISWDGETAYEKNLNGKLVWRWTVDMKWFDSLMLTMIKKLLMEESKYNIKFLFYDKEEVWNSGVEEMYKSGKLQEIVEDVDFTIVWEPTDTKVDNEVYTFLWWTIKINGKGWHSSQINIGDTVYSELNSLIHRVSDIQDRYKNELVLNLTKIEADNGSNNTIPSELEIWLNIRCSTSVSTEKLRQEILEEILDNLDFEETVFDEGGGCKTSIISKYLWDIPTNSAKYWSDIAILNKITPAVNWWPGSITQAHNYNETLLVKDLRNYISSLDELLF